MSRALLIIGTAVATGVAIFLATRPPQPADGALVVPAGPGSTEAGLSLSDALCQALRLRGIPSHAEELNVLLNQRSLTLEGARPIVRTLGCTLQVVEGLEQVGTSGMGGLQPPFLLQADSDHYLVVAGVDRLTRPRRLLVVRENQKPEWCSAEELYVPGREAVVVQSERARRAGPAVWIAEPQMLLGTLEGGRVYQQQVGLVNVGNDVLEITGASTSCGCTRVKVEPDSLLPGEAGTVSLAIDTRKQGQGHFNVSVILQSNAIDSPTTTLTLSAKIVAQASFDPAHFALGNVLPSEQRRILESVFHCEDCDGTTVEPIYLDRGLEWHALERLQSGGLTLRLGVDFASAEVDAEGRFALRAFVRASDRERTVYELAATGTRCPWIQVMPSTVFVGRLRPGQEHRSTIRFHAFAEGETAIHVPMPEIVQARVNAASLVDVTVKAPPINGLFRTTTLLRVGTHAVNIPIAGVVNPVDGQELLRNDRPLR